MSTILPYIGFVALGALILYLIVNAIIENVKRQEFRRANREAQFSGSANKKEKGFWETLVTPKYSSKAEAIGEKGEKKVSSYLEDLDCNDYRVYNDLLIRNGRYTTQLIMLSYRIMEYLFWRRKIIMGRYMAVAMPSSGINFCRHSAINASALLRNIS